MKKILVFLMVLLAICSSVFAKEKATDNEKLTPEEQRQVAEGIVAMIDSKLDLKRWEFATATTKNDYYFIDRETLVTPYPDILEVWECHFRQADKGSCGYKSCQEKKIDSTKHYHYTRYRYDLNRLKQTITSMVTKDEAGNVVLSLDVPSYLQKEADVFPGSLGETCLKTAKRIAQEKQKKK